jgi:hypothetical protein
VDPLNMENNKLYYIKMFKHCNIHKKKQLDFSQWKKHNHINHILTERRQQSSILDSHSFREADSDPDHYLMVTKLRERLSVKHKSLICRSLGKVSRGNTV